MLLDSLVEDATGLAGIAEVLVPAQVELFELAVDGSLSIVADGKVLVGSEVEEYLRQFVGSIVIEMDGLGEAALQTGVRVDEVVHLVGISGNYADELSSVVLQTLQQGVDGFSAERVTVV